MKKKFLTVGLVLFFGISLLSSCTNNKIKINGAVHTTVEVGDIFVDEGVTYPDKYTLVQNGQVNSTKLGTYELKYSIFTDEGELVKELYRFVSVVDTQKPVYVEAPLKTFYAGVRYTVDDFLTDYSDNYDVKDKLTIEPSEGFRFSEEGSEKVDIKLTDTSGNQAVFSKTINVILEFEELIDNVYKGQIGKINKGSTGIGSNYVRVTVDSSTSFSYFDSGTVHFLKSFSSNLGTRASIQISGYYGKLDRATLNYHISGTGNTYSVGFITFNALTDYDTLVFNKFDSKINDLNLNEQDMLDEMNPRALGVLKEFKAYVIDTLGITFK